jgi:hypothetical protein
MKASRRRGAGPKSLADAIGAADVTKENIVEALRKGGLKRMVSLRPFRGPLLGDRPPPGGPSAGSRALVPETSDGRVGRCAPSRVRRWTPGSLSGLR